MDNLEYLKPSLQKRQKRRDKRLGEEVIECYRRGSRSKQMKGYKNKLKRNQYELARQKEAMKFMHGGGTKYFNDNLEPMLRFLNTHLGKNWNKLYGELCGKLDKRTLPGLHVFNHIWDFVYTDVIIQNKKAYYIHFGKYQELVSSEKWMKFYVHPKTGQLMKARFIKWKNK
jgi:transposase-like protein